MNPNKNYKEHYFKPSVDGNEVMSIIFTPESIKDSIRSLKFSNDENPTADTLWSLVGDVVGEDSITSKKT